MIARKNARSISFTDRDGRPSGKVRVGETGGNGNAHFRHGKGPVCGTPRRNGGYCAEPWQPVCPDRDCDGNIEPRRVMRIERYGHKPHERRDRNDG